MPETLLTASNMRFIKKNRLKMSGADMARKFSVDKNIVTRYMRKNGLQVPRELKLKFRREGVMRKMDLNSPEMKFIKKNYLKFPSKTLATMMGRTDNFIRHRLKRLGLMIPQDIIDQRKKDSQIKPGNIPPNKGKKMSKAQYKKCQATMFKKGQLPANAIGFKNGDIVIRQSKRWKKKSYKYIRISLGKWYPYHQYKWEKKNGKLPDGFCLWFRDGNSLNCKLKNLELITRAENMRRNSCSLRLTDNFVAMSICGKNNMHMMDEILKDKKLIQVKRYQLLLKRTIKQHDTKRA